VFHGSPNAFTDFSENPNGIFFSPSPEYAEQYGKNITRANVSMSRPLDLSNLGGDVRNNLDIDELRTALADAGIDVSDMPTREDLDDPDRLFHASEAFYDPYGDIPDGMVNRLKDAGYDGVIFPPEDPLDASSKSLLVVEPSQISPTSTAPQAQQEVQVEEPIPEGEQEYAQQTAYTIATQVTEKGRGLGLRRIIALIRAGKIEEAKAALVALNDDAGLSLSFPDYDTNARHAASSPTEWANMLEARLDQAEQQQGEGAPAREVQVEKPPAPTPESRAKRDAIPVVTDDEFVEGWDRTHAGLASEEVARAMAVGMEGIEGREYGIREHSPGKWQIVSRPLTAPQTPAEPTPTPEPTTPAEATQEQPQTPEQIAQQAIDSGQNLHAAVKAATGLKMGTKEYTSIFKETAAAYERLKKESPAEPSPARKRAMEKQAEKQKQEGKPQKLTGRKAPPELTPESLKEAIAEELAKRPKKRSEKAADRREAAKQRFLDAAKRAIDPTKPSMGLDPSRVTAAVEAALAAVDYGIATFDQFISMAVENFGEQNVRDSAPYLEEAARQTGIENVTSVDEVLKAEAPPPPPPPQAPPQGPRSQYTGIKRERLEAQADAMGLPRPRAVESVNAIELVEDAVARLTPERDRDIQIMAAEVLAERKAITVEETADLLASVDYHKRQAEAADDLYNKHMKEGEHVKAQKADEESTLHKAAMHNAAQAARDVGRRQFAYMGHVLQVLVDPDSKAHIERLLRKANGGRLEEGDREWAAKMADKLAKAKKKQAKRGREIDEEQATAQADDKKAELENELKRERVRKKRKPRNRTVTDEAKNAAVSRIRKKAKELLSTSSAVPVGKALEMLPDAAIVAAYHVESGLRRLAEFSQAMITDLGEWVKPYLSDLHRQARADYATARLEVLRERLSKADDIRGHHRAVSEMAKEILAETRREDGSFIHREELLDRLHEEIREFEPDITRREVMDMFSGYGQYKELSQDELEVAYRDRRGETRELGKIDDMQNKIPPGATGQERHTPSDEERELHRQVRELKKQGEREGWYQAGSRANKLKSTLDAQKTRLRNEIHDLDAQIAAGVKVTKRKSQPLSDAELEALRKERDQRKEMLDAAIRAAKEADMARWENEGGAILDPAVEQYLTVLNRQIQSLQKQIENKDVFPKAAMPRPGGQAVDAKKARIDALRAEKAALRKLIDPDFETNQKLRNAEKAAEREVAKLEEEQREGFRMREPRAPLPESDRLREARQKLAALRQQRMEALEDEYALKAAIAQAKRNAANIADRLTRGDYAPRKRKPQRVWDDPEWKKAKDEELALRKQLADKQAQYEWARMSPFAKGWYWTRVASGVWKGLLAGFDWSMIKIQNTLAVGANPYEAIQSIMPTAQAMASAKSRERIDAEREAHPRYEDYMKWGLALSEHGKRGETAVTEMFPTDQFVDKVPGVAMSERSFATYMNEMRFRVMQALEQAYGKPFLPFVEPDGMKLNDTTGPALARVVNMLTFAWKPEAKRAKDALAAASVVMWAPSMYVARLQALFATPVWLNKGADPRIRRIAAVQLLKGWAGIYLVHALLRWLWSDDDQEESPLSSDFGKVKKGDVRVEVSGGLMQQVVLGSRIAEQGIAPRQGRKPETAEGTFARSTVYALLGTFAGYKINPWFTAPINWWQQKDFLGRPATMSSIAVENLTPLSVQNLIEAVEETGPSEGAFLGGIGGIGMPSSIYSRSNPKSEETFLATVQRLAQRAMGETPELEPEQMEKWLENKVQWDTDLEAAAKILSPEQLKMAERKVHERRTYVVYNAAYAGDNEKEIATRDKNREYLQEMGITYQEAAQMLMERFKDTKSDAYKARSNALYRLYH